MFLSMKNSSANKKKSSIKEQLKNLPQAPGVYFFKDARGNLLYIGKATNLRSRASSYFRNVVLGAANNSEISRGIQDDNNAAADVPGRSEWIARMVSLVANVVFEQTDSVLEALILESNLIKKYQPKYNTLEKDDKSFAYFVVTKEEIPRVLIFRKTDIDFEKKEAKRLKQSTKLKAIYGPYVSRRQMETALKIIRRIFPFHALGQKTEKGCLDFQLGLCPGPYDGAISKEDYKKNIRGIRMILEGRKKRLVSTLGKEMEEAAKKHEFEKAADIRNKIFALEHIRDIALMTREFDEQKFQIANGKFQENSKLQNQNDKKIRIEAYDISNISGRYAVGSMVVFENGKPNKSQYRKFKIKAVEGSDDVGMMREVLSRRFKNNWPMPDLILLDGGQGHANMFSKLINELGLAVLAVAVAKGPTRKNLNLQFPISNKIPMAQFTEELQSFLGDKNLLKSIMDEAHRFAIGYHRKIRDKGVLAGF